MNKIKDLYKIDLFLLKLLPVIMALSCATNLVSYYFNFNLQIITHYVGLVIAPLSFIYLSSRVFKFCNYHRMFIYYVALEELLLITDWYFNIPIADDSMRIIQLIITGIFLFITTIMYIKKRKQIRLCNKKPEPSS